MGPFQGFGPNWDQVPNLGHHYEHCSCYLDFFFSETKFSETETFFRRPKFSETETETFFPKPNFPKPKPRLFSETKFFRNRNRDFFSETKFSETETLKDLAKVSKPRDFETEMSISGHDQLNLSTTDVFFVACIVYLPNICAAHVFKKVLIESPRLR